MLTEYGLLRVVVSICAWEHNEVNTDQLDVL